MRHAWTLLVLSLLLIGCETLRLPASLALTEGDALTEGRTGARAHATPEAVAVPLRQAWRYNAEAGFGPAAVLVAGGHLVVVNRAGEAHVIDAEAGKRVGTVGLGEAGDGAPVLLDGRTLVVPLSAGRNGLIAYDLVRGSRTWTLRDAPHAAGLLLARGVLVAAALDGTVRGLDPATGSERWAVRPDTLAAFYASPVEAADDLVVVADDRGGVTALAPLTGAIRWRRSLGAPVLSTPTRHGRAVVVPTTRGQVVALDAATGEVDWIYAVSDETVRFAAAAASADALVLGATDGLLRRLDPATGAERWATRFDGALTAAPLLAGETVFVGTMGRELAAVDPATGAVLWDTELGGRIKTAPVVAGGRLVVLVEPKDVIAFEPVPNVAGPQQ